LKKFDPGPLRYKRIDDQKDGVYYCDGRPFHLTVKFLSKVPKHTISRQKLLDDIKQALLDISPEITPGQTKLSYTDIVWEASEMGQFNEEGTCPALKTLVEKINIEVHESTAIETKFNAVRLIYAHDRSVKMNLRATNGADIPLVALHIGKPRDLSITPKRFNPACETSEICDIHMGNYSLIIFPNDSRDHH
jgi:hypothetical protein